MGNLAERVLPFPKDKITFILMQVLPHHPALVPFAGNPRHPKCLTLRFLGVSLHVMMKTGHSVPTTLGFGNPLVLDKYDQLTAHLFLLLLVAL